MNAATATSTVSGLPRKGIHGVEAKELAESQVRAFAEMLESLDGAAWDLPTDCDLWTVKDIAVHLLGWAETLTSPTAYLALIKDTRKRRGQFPNKVDAQNQVLVDMRRDLPPAEVITRFRVASRRFLGLRLGIARFGRFVPIYVGFLGPTNLGYLASVIFTRDMFMHRIDIARATGAPLKLGPAEQRLVADVVRDWFRRSGAHARLELTGPAGGVFASEGEHRAVIKGDAIEFCRLMTGRCDAGVLDVEGDRDAARRWLDVHAPF